MTHQANPKPPSTDRKTLVEVEIEVHLARSAFGLVPPLNETVLFQQKDPRWLNSLAGGDQCA